MDERWGNRLKKKSNVLTYILVIVLASVFIFPVLWVVFSSLKNSTELYSWPPRFIPKSPTIENFITAFDQGNFGIYFFNSAIVTIVATIITLLINTMAGYALAKYRFKGDTFLLI